MELAVFNNIMHSQNRLKNLIIYMHDLVTHKMIFCKIKIMISDKIKCCLPVMYNNLSKNKNKAKQSKLCSSSQLKQKMSLFLSKSFFFPLLEILYMLFSALMWWFPQQHPFGKWRINQKRRNHQLEQWNIKIWEKGKIKTGTTQNLENNLF